MSYNTLTKKGGFSMSKIAYIIDSTTLLDEKYKKLPIEIVQLNVNTETQSFHEDQLDDEKTMELINNNIEAVVVGTAFDYLARFRIAQVVRKNNMKVMENLVAENFFDRFKGRLSRRSYNKLIDEYNYAIENIKRYIELNIPFDKEIIEKTCILAKLEACWRDGKLPNDLKYLFNSKIYFMR